jgi:hypothetical protein
VGTPILKGIAVKLWHTVTRTRPPEGKAAFVGAEAMLSQGTRSAALHPTFRMAILCNRNGGLSNPGEGTT